MGKAYLGNNREYTSRSYPLVAFPGESTRVGATELFSSFHFLSVPAGQKEGGFR
jgi:hypothetical protein